jgi:hypothetical protein
VLEHLLSAGRCSAASGVSVEDVSPGRRCQRYASLSLSNLCHDATGCITHGMFFVCVSFCICTRHRRSLPSALRVWLGVTEAHRYTPVCHRKARRVASPKLAKPPRPKQKSSRHVARRPAFRSVISPVALRVGADRCWTWTLPSFLLTKFADT